MHLQEITILTYLQKSERQLISYVSKESINDIETSINNDEVGYAIANFATVYLLNASKITMNELTIVGLNDTPYSNAALYLSQANGVTLDNNTIEGSSWGIYMTSSPDGTISNNLIKNQKT